MSESDERQSRIARLCDRAEIEADQASTLGELARAKHRFLGAWKAAFDPEALDEIREGNAARYHSICEGLGARHRAICSTLPPIELETCVDSATPTLDNFFYAPFWAEPVQPAPTLGSVEARLGVVLPDTLRALYARQDGGMTDFNLFAKVHDAPYHFTGPGDSDTFLKAWRWVWPDQALYPLSRLRSLGDMADDMYEPDDEEGFRATTPDVDRLIILAAHGCDAALCLDYRGSAEPSVVLLDITADPEPTFEANDFATFFAGLRRQGIIERDGARCRGLRDLHDDEA